MEDRQTFLKAFIDRNKINNTTFKQWAKDVIKYKAAKDVLSKSAISNDTSKVTIVNQLLKDIPLTTDGNIKCTSYDYYLQYYLFYLLSENKNNHDHNAESHNHGVSSTAFEEFNFLKGKVSGESRSLLLSKYLYDKLGKGKSDIPIELINEYESIVPEEFIKSPVLEKYKVLYQKGIHEPIKDIVINNVDNDVNNLLPEIISRHQGKTIYIDLWATWCQPCLKEMPIYKKFYKEFEQEDIQFVFLAVDSSKEKWYKKIRELELKGEHYLLSGDQYLTLQRKLYIDGIPHYVLIDKSGKIVDDMAPRPSMGSGKAMNKKLISAIKNIL